MLYGWLIRRRAVVLWEMLSDQDLEGLPLAHDTHFRYLGDHGLAVDLHSAQELRDWLRALLERFPGLRFEIDEVVVGGPPWAVHMATRYTAVQNGRPLYNGAQFTLVRLGACGRGMDPA